MTDIDTQVQELAQSRGYATAQEMKQHMGSGPYARLMQNLMPLAKSGVPFEVIRNTADLTTRTIRVYLVMQPEVYVDVKTTESRVRAKLRGIRSDIWDQKFPRWAPFAGLPEASGDGQGGKRQVPSWAWKFV